MGAKNDIIIILLFTQAFLDIPSASSSNSSRGSLCELFSYFQTYFLSFFFGRGAMLIFIFRLIERIRSGNN